VPVQSTAVSSLPPMISLFAMVAPFISLISRFIQGGRVRSSMMLSPLLDLRRRDQTVEAAFQLPADLDEFVELFSRQVAQQHRGIDILALPEAFLGHLHRHRQSCAGRFEFFC
jgi:hypothetical protein